MKLRLSQIAALMDCPVSQEAWIKGTAIDSRKIRKGDLFIALTGEHTDGHQYLDAAQQAGAVAALVQEKQTSSLPQIVVNDVRRAFTEIATFWRHQCPATVIAITGSNGKTTVKEMVASILKQAGSIIATQGNLNNELGVPLTLCRLETETEFAVIEMGANHPGEITALTRMAQPDISLITTISAAHLEGFGSIDGVAKAKAEIYSGLAEDGVAIVNNDLPYAKEWKRALTDRKIVTFALDNEAGITAFDIQQSADSSQFKVMLNNEMVTINLPLPGQHNIANALAAIASVSALNLDPQAIKTGLENMRSVPHRLQFRTSINQAVVIDDSYNANPGSFQQALNVLTACQGKHWLVLGDFSELGEKSQYLHEQIGSLARQAGVEKLLTVGIKSKWVGKAFGQGARHFDSVDDVFEVLNEELTEDVTCLIKGSRSMQLDKLADRLAISGEN